MNNLCQTPQKTLPAVVGILKALRVGCTNTYIYPRNINSTAHSEYRLLVNAKGYACTWNTNKVKDVLHSFQSKDASKISCGLLGIAWEPVPMDTVSLTCTFESEREVRTFYFAQDAFKK